MRRRLLVIAMLEVGLATTLALVTIVAAVNAQIPAELQIRPTPSVDNQDALWLREGSAELAPWQTITFTPAFTVYLPLTLNAFDASACSNPPTLVRPLNNSRVDSLWPLYEWNWRNNPGATETHFEIALDAAFSQRRYWSQSTVHGTTDKPTFTRPFYNLIPDTVYYWRVFLKCGSDRTLYSDVWSFTPNSGGIILPPPELLAPPNGAQSSTPTVTLRWSPLSGATQYMARYRPIGGFETSRVISDTSVSVGPLGAATMYEWWVSGINDYAVGSPSTRWRFTTP